MEQKVVRMENELVMQNQKIEKKGVNMDSSITNHKYQLATYANRLKIVEESTKRWDRLQPKFHAMRQDMETI